MKTFASNGFRIHYGSWGNPKDRALLFFHGFPGSHIQASSLTPLLQKHKIFLLACDRPGYGSTFGTGTNQQYLDAIAALLASMQIAKFGIIGVSGGAPWAHLMASRYYEQVRALGIICGLASYNRESGEYFSKFQSRGLLLRKFMPAKVAEALLNRALRHFADPEKRLARFLKILNASDREILGDPAYRALILSSMQQARAQGAKGIVRDSALYNTDWLRVDCDGERLKSVRTFYFHGEQDRILDPRMSAWMQKKNPHAQLRFFAEDGHYSLPFRQADFILGNL